MRNLLIFLILVFLFCSSCRSTSPTTGNDGQLRYAAVFTDRPMQQSYTGLMSSVVRLTTFINYQTVVFDADSLITADELQKRDVLKMTEARIVQNESFLGTAMVAAGSENRRLLLTCAHLVSFPDTIYNFSNRANAWGSRYLLGFSVKTGEVIQASCGSGSIQAGILVLDDQRDLALLQLASEYEDQLPKAAGVQLADLQKLNIGDRLFIGGFPSGQFMMTTGILSLPAGNTGLLLTDAPFSEGYSGAPAMVYDRQDQTFLLAGIGRSVAARTSYCLKPEKEIYEAEYNSTLPYEGPVFVETERKPASGVTFITSSARIGDFLRENREVLRKAGWSGLFPGGPEK